MRNAMLTPEERERLIRQYQNDTVIKSMKAMMAHLATIAPSTFFIYNAGPVIGLPKSYQNKIDEINAQLKEYCESTYPELYETTI